MVKDAAGLAEESLNNSRELARSVLDNLNDLSSAAQELKSRVSFIQVQVQKAKADAEKLADEELKAEIIKGTEREQVWLSKVTSLLSKVDALMGHAKEKSSEVEKIIATTPAGKDKEERVISTMNLSLELLKRVTSIQKDYLACLRYLALVRFYVETLEDLLAGEVTAAEAEKNLRRNRPRRSRLPEKVDFELAHVFFLPVFAYLFSEHLDWTHNRPGVKRF